MNIRQTLAKTRARVAQVPTKVWLIGGGIAVVVLYSLIFFIPNGVQFSYANQTCARQFVMAPGLQKANSDDFTVEFKDEVRIGSVAIASGAICVTPKDSPDSGTYAASISPFGGPLASKQVRITVPEAPSAKTSDFIGAAISTAKPLKIALTSPDIIHAYTLEVAEKKAPCKQSDSKLSCDIASLGLDHGAKYTAVLHKSFKNDDKKVAEGTLETLQPLLLTEASIADGHVFYDKPTSVAFAFDQAITDAEVSLEKVTGDTTETLPVKAKVEGAGMVASFDELPREATYRLTVKQASGENGSSLAGPSVYTFQTSGGPKVSSVSVGSGGVARNATIIVTFDQPVDASVDVAKVARIEGAAGSVRKQSDTQFAFALQAGDCTAFSLVIDKGIKSGSNGELAKEGWKFGSRTACGYSWSIGTSVKGRPIIAHSFGGGATTILFTGAIHGSEPSSNTTMQAWVQYLQANGHIVPADKRVVIVPNMNPDGIAAGSRNNSRNVNLGRNFATANWQASIQTANGTLPTGGGTAPGSEPESAALIALTRQLRPRLAVSFHAQGSLVGANKFSDSVRIGNIYASTVGYRTMYDNAEAVMGYPMTGEYEDWVGETMGIPAILIELPTLSGNYITSQLPALKKLLAI